MTKNKLFPATAIISLCGLTAACLPEADDDGVVVSVEQSTVELQGATKQEAITIKQTVTGIEPGDIDVTAGGTDGTRTDGGTRLVTYGPVITIKPKG